MSADADFALHSDRLQLTPWRPGDVDLFRPLASDPAVLRYITDGVPFSEERVREFVSRQVSHFRDRGYCLWRLHERATSEFVGFCGLQSLPGTGEIEVGWWLHQAHWRRGLATEAAQVVIHDGLTRAGLRRIVAITRHDNVRSQQVMERLGMRYERDTVHNGVPVLLYALEQTSIGQDRR